jgi:catechol 2,3-dioxygenase-like lactoylglutathione lyase family enzyme
MTAAVKLLGVHHVALSVSDLAESMRFYVDQLGLEELERPDFGFPGAWLALGDQQVHLLELAEPVHPSNHFAIHVVDIDEAIAGLRAAGIEVSDPSPVGTGRQAFLKDPTGNLIELNQPN